MTNNGKDFGDVESSRRSLQLQRERSPSIGPKVAITLWYLACIGAAVWMTFLAPPQDDASGNVLRQVALLACVLINVLTAATTLFVFVKRRIPWWEAIWGGSLIGIVLFFFLREGLRVPATPRHCGCGGDIALCRRVVCRDSASEYSRHLWKAAPENQGHLYTGGLFRYSRHINYFGDLLIFLGCGVLTSQLWTVIVPLAMRDATNSATP